ncbi:hypothetical protein M2239_004787 [Bradyrhizobium elkanii]|nr:hypothetical protein [Bradyrhizobium elkanii]
MEASLLLAAQCRRIFRRPRAATHFWRSACRARQECSVHKIGLSYKVCASRLLKEAGEVMWAIRGPKVVGQAGPSSTSIRRDLGGARARTQRRRCRWAAPPLQIWSGGPMPPTAPTGPTPAEVPLRCGRSGAGVRGRKRLPFVPALPSTGGACSSPRPKTARAGIPTTIACTHPRQRRPSVARSREHPGNGESEPPRDCRRPFGLSHAAIPNSSVCA